MARWTYHRSRSGSFCGHCKAVNGNAVSLRVNAREALVVRRTKECKRKSVQRLSSLQKLSNVRPANRSSGSQISRFVHTTTRNLPLSPQSLTVLTSDAHTHWHDSDTTDQFALMVACRVENIHYYSRLSSDHENRHRYPILVVRILRN